MSEAGVYFHACLSFPQAAARAAWGERRLDPWSDAGKKLLAPFRSIWSDDVRTELFGSSVGLHDTAHDEDSARKALAPLIGADRVERVETRVEPSGNKSYTFHLAGELARGTTVDELCAFLEESDLAFSRVDEGEQVELLAWLPGYDGFERFGEVLTLAALSAHGLATSAHGFFFPSNEVTHDLSDYGEFAWSGESPELRFEVCYLQDLTEEAERWINEAMPKLEPLIADMD